MSTELQRPTTPPPSYTPVTAAESASTTPPLPGPSAPAVRPTPQMLQQQVAQQQQRRSATAPTAPSAIFSRRGIRSGAAVAAPPAQVDAPRGLAVDPLRTLVAMCVDRSGSMASMGAEVEGGCNAYLDQQRETDAADTAAAPDAPATTDVLFSVFDNIVDSVYDGGLAVMPEVTHEQVKPRGGTALYDAIGDTLVRVAAKLTAAAAAAAPGPAVSLPAVTVFILTDGQENGSQRWTKAKVTKEITRLQGEGFGWDFYFAAANQDAMVSGSSLGFAAEQCMTYGNTGSNQERGMKMKAAMKMSNVAFQRKKKGGFSGYSAEERADCF